MAGTVLVFVPAPVYSGAEVCDATTNAMKTTAGPIITCFYRNRFIDDVAVCCNTRNRDVVGAGYITGVKAKCCAAGIARREISIPEDRWRASGTRSAFCPSYRNS